MAHPRDRAARRMVRRRIIARRVAQTRMRWSPFWSPPNPRMRGMYDSFNPLVCCARCQYDDPREARWRWDRVLVDGDLLRTPIRREGMSPT